MQLDDSCRSVARILVQTVEVLRDNSQQPLSAFQLGQRDMCGVRLCCSNLARKGAPCGGYLKSATILFGQHIPADVLARAKALTESCDLFMVVGSSLKVSPAANLPRLAVQNAAPLLIVNLIPTPLDSHADAVIHEQAGLALPRLVEML